MLAEVSVTNSGLVDVMFLLALIFAILASFWVVTLRPGLALNLGWVAVAFIAAGLLFS
jgi:biopolymer transport protein ExbD